MLKTLVFENANISIATEILPVRNVQNNPDGQSAFYFMVSQILWSIWHWPDSKMCSFRFTSWPHFWWLMRGGPSPKDLHTFSDNKGTDRLEKGDWLPRARKRERGRLTHSCWRQRGRKLAHSPLRSGEREREEDDPFSQAQERGRWPVLAGAREEEEGSWPILPCVWRKREEDDPFLLAPERKRKEGGPFSLSIPCAMEKERGRWPILISAREEERDKQFVLTQ